jgi:hypothetical protein
MIREHGDYSDTPADNQPDAPDARERTADDGVDIPIREEDAHGIDAQIAAAYRHLYEHPPSEEEIRRREALLDKLDAELSPTNSHDDSPDRREPPSDLPPHVEDATPDDGRRELSTSREEEANRQTGQARNRFCTERSNCALMVKRARSQRCQVSPFRRTKSRSLSPRTLPRLRKLVAEYTRQAAPSSQHRKG